MEEGRRCRIKYDSDKGGSPVLMLRTDVEKLSVRWFEEKFEEKP
jgi:hypothetical protein